MSESIDAAFGYNSEFRKGIAKAIEEVVPIPKADDLALFANAVREVLQRRLANLASDTAREHLDELLKKILPDSREIAIDELKKAYIDKIKSEASREYDDEEITWYGFDAVVFRLATGTAKLKANV